MIKLAMRSPHPSPFETALDRTVKLALRSVPHFAQGGPGIVIMTSPPGYELTDYQDVLSSILSTDDEDFPSTEGGLLYIRASDASSKVQKSFDLEFQSHQRIIVLAEKSEAIPPTVLVAADAVVEVPPIGPDDLRWACKAALKMKVNAKQAREALQYPWPLLSAALRPGRSMEDVLARLSSLPSVASKTRDADVPALTEMFGYGRAKEWGFQLATDLCDWRAQRIPWNDVDRGILLSGPPGVGKTIFARALAKHCEATLVSCSLGRWQASGHLGDLLKAMRADFARAKGSAPSILFIDELDSVGDRNDFHHQDSSYSTQVVNALLECIDGLDGREGVVVVGATNNPNRIDTALLRSGRLDRHVEIGMPGPGDRIAILHQLAGCTFPASSTPELQLATEGMTGADIAKAVRDARRLARRNSRTLQVGDILEVLPRGYTVDAEFLRAVAIHETGHTLVGVRLRCGEFICTFVRRRLAHHFKEAACGAAQFSIATFGRRDRQSYLDQIALLVAGIAAEELWLGAIGDGAGGSSDSDLGRATKLATLLEAGMGMGSTLRYSHAPGEKELEDLRRSDPRLRSRIEKTLSEQFVRAKTILAEQESLARLIIDELSTSGRLTASRLEELTTRETNVQATARRRPAVRRGRPRRVTTTAATSEKGDPSIGGSSASEIIPSRRI